MTTRKIADYRVPRLAVEPSLMCVLDENGDIVTPIADTETGAWIVQNPDKEKVNTPAYLNYSSSNIDDTAWTELVASLADNVTRIHIFDSSGYPIRLAVGSAGNEVELFRIAPGGDGQVDIGITSGSRLSVRALSGTIDDGELIINFLG
jgi:hypothetical protein